MSDNCFSKLCTRCRKNKKSDEELEKEKEIKRMMKEEVILGTEAQMEAKMFEMKAKSVNSALVKRVDKYIQSITETQNAAARNMQEQVIKLKERQKFINELFGMAYAKVKVTEKAIHRAVAVIKAEVKQRQEAKCDNQNTESKNEQETDTKNEKTPNKENTAKKEETAKKKVSTKLQTVVVHCKRLIAQKKALLAVIEKMEDDGERDVMERRVHIDEVRELHSQISTLNDRFEDKKEQILELEARKWMYGEKSIKIGLRQHFIKRWNLLRDMNIYELKAVFADTIPYFHNWDNTNVLNEKYGKEIQRQMEKEIAVFHELRASFDVIKVRCDEMIAAKVPDFNSVFDKVWKDMKQPQTEEVPTITKEDEAKNEATNDSRSSTIDFSSDEDRECANFGDGINEEEPKADMGWLFD